MKGNQFEVLRHWIDFEMLVEVSTGAQKENVI